MAQEGPKTGLQGEIDPPSTSRVRRMAKAQRAPKTAVAAGFLQKPVRLTNCVYNVYKTSSYAEKT